MNHGVHFLHTGTGDMAKGISLDGLGIVRTFTTGATLDQDQDKFDLEGFESPLVMQRFSAYMHQNRLQADGQLRASDNWQKGIPTDAYMKSMMRHFMAIWLHHRGEGHLAKESLETALCALRFNVNGYLFEVLRETSTNQRSV